MKEKGAIEGEIVEVIPGGGQQIDSFSGDGESASDESSSVDEDAGGVFGMKDMAAELAAFEESMTQFMRLNLLFSQISTQQFSAFIRNEAVELL